MTLKVVEPIEITEAVLTASDIPEPDTARGEVEWVPGRVSVVTKQKHRAASFNGGVAYVTGVGYFMSTIETGYDNGIYFYHYYIDHYDEDFNYLKSLLLDGMMASLNIERPRYIFSAYNADINSSYGLYTLCRDVSNTSLFKIIKFNTEITTYEEIGSADMEVSISSLSLGGSVAATGDSFTIAARDGGEGQSTPYTFYKFPLTGGLATSKIDAPQSVHYACYRYEMQHTTNGLSLAGFTSDVPGDDRFSVVINLDENYKVISTQDLSPATTYSSTNGNFSSDSDGYCFINSGGASSDFYCEFYDYDGVTDGAYHSGDRVMLSSNHKVYECVRKTRISPVDGVDNIPPEWVEVGPTNKWAMFDDQNSTTTKSSGSFSVELESSDYIMAYGVTGSSGLTSVRCQVYDSGSNLIYDDTQSAFDNVGSPGDFIYASEDVFYKKKLYQTDIPPTENFKAVFTFNGSDIEIGNLTVGPAIELGPCLSDSKNESLDLSEQVFDDFGNETYTERPIITFATYETISSIESSNIINRFLNVIRRKGCLWIGEVGYNQSIVTFGRIERDPIPYTMPTEIRYTIRVRGFA